MLRQHGESRQVSATFLETFNSTGEMRRIEVEARNCHALGKEAGHEPRYTMLPFIGKLFVVASIATCAQQASAALDASVFHLELPTLPFGHLRRAGRHWS